MTRWAALPRRRPAGPATMDAAAYRRAQSELAFQRAVTDLAELTHWTWHHMYDSRTVNRDGVGLPDLILLRPPRLLFVELKRAGGVVSDDQRRWLALLRLVPGIEVYVWTPGDWPAIQEVLAA